MRDFLLSGDGPRSRALAWLLAVVVVLLAAGPFLFSSTRAFSMLGAICIFIIVVAAYDLMLGYTHIVSFAHTMFFGIGAYAVAMAIAAWGNNLAAVAGGVCVALALSLLLALLLGLLSLRVKAIFFALVTLAVAFAFLSLVNQLYHITGGEDGLRVRAPPMLEPAWRMMDGSLPGFGLDTFFANLGAGLVDAVRAARFDVRPTGRLLMYYIAFTTMGLVFLFLLRLVNSPFGKVLQAIRENEFRAQALGYRTVLYRTAVVMISAMLAALAGALYALFNRYVNPENTLNFELMVFILLMCVIGGMGTLYGAIIGVAVFLLAQNYLQDALRALAAHVPPDGWLAELVSPDRWLLWFGLLFVLSIYFFPSGIVGHLRTRTTRRKASPPPSGRTKIV